MYIRLKFQNYGFGELSELFQNISIQVYSKKRKVQFMNEKSENMILLNRWHNSIISQMNQMTASSLAARMSVFKTLSFLGT